MRYLATIGVLLVLAGLTANANAYDKGFTICKYPDGTEIVIPKPNAGCPPKWGWN